MMKRSLGFALSLALGLLFAGVASDASAQAGDQKRSLKAQKKFYKEPGFLEVDVRAMRKMLMLTGSVPTEEHKKKADELAGKVKGIKEVRNRLIVRDAEPAPGCEALMAKLDEKIEKDEELAQAKRKLEIKCEDSKLTVKGKVKDYTVASSLVTEVKRIPGVVALNFDKLKY